MQKVLLALILLFVYHLVNAQHQEVPFTLADRDRLIQTEARLESLSVEVGSLRNDMNSLRNEMNSLRNEMNSLRNEMDARFEAVNAKIDYMFWVQGVIIALIIFLLGFIIWDRRTAMAPMRTDIERLKWETERMKSGFRVMADDKPTLLEKLKNAGIL